MSIVSRFDVPSNTVHMVIRMYLLTAKQSQRWDQFYLLILLPTKFNWILIFVLIFVMDLPTNIIHFSNVIFAQAHSMCSQNFEKSVVMKLLVVTMYMYICWKNKNQQQQQQRLNGFCSYCEWQLRVPSSKLRLHVHLFFNKIITHSGSFGSAPQVLSWAMTILNIEYFNIRFIT